MTKNHVFLQDFVQLNDYDVFVASISLWDEGNKAIFNSLYSLTKISDLEEDLKKNLVKKAYVFHGYMDMLLATSRIWNSHPDHILYGNDDCIEALKMKMEDENANPNFISNLSNLTERPIRIADYVVSLDQKRLEIFGLDDSCNKITLVWVPSAKAMLLGENMLRNIKGLYRA